MSLKGRWHLYAWSHSIVLKSFPSRSKTTLLWHNTICFIGITALDRHLDLNLLGIPRKTSWQKRKHRKNETKPNHWLSLNHQQRSLVVRICGCTCVDDDVFELCRSGVIDIVNICWDSRFKIQDSRFKIQDSRLDLHGYRNGKWNIEARKNGDAKKTHKNN